MSYSEARRSDAGLSRKYRLRGIGPALHAPYNGDQKQYISEVVGLLFHLDYLSCLLTVLSTILVGRKLWAGLVIAAINSVLVCVIGVKTAQYGFIPANLFCIVVYALSIRSWRKDGAGHHAEGVGSSTQLALVAANASEEGNGMSVPATGEDSWDYRHRRFLEA